MKTIFKRALLICILFSSLSWAEEPKKSNDSSIFYKKATKAILTGCCISGALCSAFLASETDCFPTKAIFLYSMIPFAYTAAALNRSLEDNNSFLELFDKLVKNDRTRKYTKILFGVLNIASGFCFIPCSNKHFSNIVNYEKKDKRYQSFALLHHLISIPLSFIMAEGLISSALKKSPATTAASASSAPANTAQKK